MKPNQYHPTRDFLLLERHTARLMTPGGLHIPATEERLQTYDIVAVGPKIEDERLKVGACCACGKYAGQDLKELGENYLVVREEEVVALVDADARAVSPKGVEVKIPMPVLGQS